MIAQDYMDIWYTYLPHGFLWPEQEGDSPYWDMYAEAQAQEWGRVDEAALGLVNEAIPDGVNYPDDLLDYWERVADLDPSGLTDTERREALIAKLRGSGAPTKKRFSEQIDPVTESNAILDGWQIVNSMDSSWSTIGSGSVDTDAETGPDGEETAELITMPAASDGAEIDILRMSNYEALSVSFHARAITLTDFDVDITLVGRDGADKYTDTFTFTNAWRRYSFDVSDIGTGGSDPKLQIELDTGTNEILAIDNVVAGWKRRYIEQFTAGRVCGLPSAPGWEFVWGVEYGEDLVNRDIGGNPDWANSGSGVITDNYARCPVSRNQLADRLYTATTLENFDSEITTTASTVRVSFWGYSVGGSSVVLNVLDRTGGVAYTETLLSLADWVKYDCVVDLGTGGSTPKIRIILDGTSTPPCDFYISHVRVSAVNETLENIVEAGTPLHAQPIFLSYGELSETGE